jgi:hypothetical protein
MEALAGGAVAGLIYEDAVENSTMAGLGPCGKQAVATSQFTSKHRALFGADRTRVADVGLFYSVPQELYRADSSLGQSFVYHGLEFSEVKGSVARVLEDNHILYDVLLLDMPGVSLYNHTAAAKLAQFTLLILPAVDIISRADMEQLAAWTRGGGTLVFLDPNATAVYDENLEAGPHDLVAGLITESGRGSVRTLDWASIHDYYFLGANSSQADALASAFTPPAPSIKVEGLPATAWINVYRHGGGPMHTVHIVNYDGNATTNVLRSIAHPFTMTLACGDSCSLLTQAMLYRIGLAGTAAENGRNLSASAPSSESSSYPPIALTVQKTPRNNEVACTVPAIGIPGVYGAVVFSAPDEYSARAAAATARKWRERLTIASRSRGTVNRSDYSEQLADAAFALDSVQASSASRALNFSGLAAPFTSLAASLNASVTNLTRFVAANSAFGRNATVRTNSTLKLSAGNEVDPGGGWKQLSSTTEYTASKGYGWLPGQASSICAAATVEAGVDPLHGSCLRACPFDPEQIDVPDGAAMLRIDLQHGMEQVVTIITGSFEYVRQSATTEILVQNMSLASTKDDGTPCVDATLPGGLVFSGEFEHRAFRVPANNSGHVILTFKSGAAGAFFGDGYGEGSLNAQWVVQGILVSTGRAAPTSKASAYITLVEGLHATAVREWSMLGPFQDPYFEARSKQFGPDVTMPPTGHIDFSSAYSNGDGNPLLHWESVASPNSPLNASAPAVVLQPSAAAAQGGIDSLTFLVVYATLPKSSRDCAVLLTGSTSALGTVFVDGVAVHAMRSVYGFLVADFAVATTLKGRGESTEIRLRLMQPSWAAESGGWRAALSVQLAAAADGNGTRAVPGLVLSPQPLPPQYTDHVEVLE